MAELAGHLFSASNSISALDNNANISQGEYARTRSLIPVAGSIPTFNIIDIDNTPKGVAHTSLFSDCNEYWQGGAFSDDYYHRLRIMPSPQLALGVVLSDAASFLQVWNAFFTSVVLDGVTAVGDEGLTLVGPGPASTYLAFEVTDYTLQVSFKGPATIDAEYILEAGGKFATLEVDGTRSLPAILLPNWQGAVSERFKFSAKVTRNYDGSAQTSKISVAPRRSLSFKTLALGTASRILDNLLWKTHPFSPVIPICTDPTELVGIHLSGTTAVNVLDASTRNFYDGGFAVIVQENRFEVVTTKFVVGNVLTLATGLVSNWDAYAEIYPAAPAKMTNSSKATRYTSRHQEASLSFDLLPGDSDPNLPTEAAPNTFRGFEAYLKEPDWKDDIGHSVVSNTQLLDAQFGKKGYRISRDNADPVLSYSWGLLNRQSIHDFRAFMQRRSGSHTPVFMPTWASDLTIISSLPDTGVAFDVADDSFYAALVGADSGRNTLLVRTWTLGDFFIKVDDVLDNLDGTLTLTSDTVFTQEVPLAEIRFCCFMPLCLMGNSVDFKWLSPTIVMASASFTGIPY